MIHALFVFLACCLALAIVLVVAKKILALCELGEPVTGIAMMIIGLLGLLLLLGATYEAFSAAPQAGFRLW